MACHLLSMERESKKAARTPSSPKQLLVLQLLPGGSAGALSGNKPLSLSPLGEGEAPEQGSHRVEAASDPNKCKNVWREAKAEGPFTGLEAC